MTPVELRDALLLMDVDSMGDVMHSFVAFWTGMKFPENTDSYDLVGRNGERWECKMARAKRKSKTRIFSMENGLHGLNVLSFVGSWGPKQVATYGESFTASFPHVKPECFDHLAYGILFTDRVFLLRATSEEVRHFPGLIKQARESNNDYFRLSRVTLARHLGKRFWGEFTYDQVLDVFERSGHFPVVPYSQAA